ncbi:MAG: Polyketide Cyclase Snoal [Thermococcales archaeon 44_46]|nr:MAG: Polyketide Cyclase Snoal [Thermococcales archaeon 44_46]MDK2782990.1 hypothetical protein [Thermococcaceae archaeon]HIH73697.1 ester cyclase [Thermococcaceae archaeon]
MTSEKEKILQQVVEEIWNTGNVELVDKFYVPNFVNHDPVNPNVKTLEQFREWVLFNHKVFPDFHVTIEDIIAQDNKIVKRWTATGTHKAEMMGIPPTNRQVTIRGVAIYRFEGLFCGL